MRIAVCEDEEKQKLHVQKLINEWGDQTGVEAEADFYVSGEYFLSSWDSGIGYDIVFLDIYLKGLDGMRTAQKLRERDEQLMIVFLTSRIEYVLKGYEVNAWRYLLKPVHTSEFFLCLNKAKEISERGQQAMVIYSNNRYCKISYNTITYIESFAHYVVIHTQDSKYQMRAGISQLEAKLPTGFYRCHRSYIVNLHWIDEVEDGRIRLDNEWIQVSGRKQEQLMEYFTAYNKDEKRTNPKR